MPIASNPRIEDLEKNVREAQAALKAARDSLPPETVKNYTLTTAHGPVELSEMFGKHDRLLLIHNMGRGCPYCTLWADGFNGFTPHLENFLAFWVISNDGPVEQRAFAMDRGWKFKMASAQGTTLGADLGLDDAGTMQPGVSALVKKGNTIERVAFSNFGPDDRFCGFWPLMGMFKDDKSLFGGDSTIKLHY